MKCRSLLIPMMQQREFRSEVLRLVRLYSSPSPALATRLSISSSTIMCTPPALSILSISASRTLSVGQPVNGMGVSPRLAS
uniref:Uncharacterized protein n=1 Tax=uncultured marine group II/III euryarchaeote KM3_35_G08 TaxID=1456438 RepID=A0A075H270_9EURY|nr:hypothetical protein [uncultured marine group II/III euryarchaeote KM3_35_G08]